MFDQKISLISLPAEYLDVQLSGRLKRGETSMEYADTIENMYALENRMLDAVVVGDAQSAKQYFNAQAKLTFKQRPAVNPLRFQKGRFTVMNTILRKALERTGMHPIYIDDISTRMSLYIESITNLAEFDTLPDHLIDTYCDLVLSKSMKNYSHLIKSCIMYIDQHISDELNLTVLADAHFVSRQYLSVLFKKETGCNLTNYIQECQMKQASILLEKTDSSITQIAECCGHKNPVYFTKIFKQYYDVTPTQYRKNYLNNLTN